MFNLREIESGLAGAHLGRRAARAKRKHKQTRTQLTSRCAHQSSDLLLRSLLTAELHPRTRATLNVEINGRIKTKTISHAACHWHITCQCLLSLLCYNGEQSWGFLNDCSVVHSLWLYTAHWQKSNACRKSIVWHQCYFCVFMCLCLWVWECVGVWIYLRCSSPRVWINCSQCFQWVLLCLAQFLHHVYTAREIAHIYRNKISTAIIINRTVYTAHFPFLLFLWNFMSFTFL